LDKITEIYLEQAKEVDLLMREGLSYNAALIKVKDMYFTESEGEKCK